MMKTHLHKLGLAAAATLLAATVYADDRLYVQCGFGGPVKDPYGKCVLAIGGTKVPGCEAVAAVVPPMPVRETMTLGADAYFDFNKSVLKPSGRAKLDEMASKLNQLGDRVTAVDLVGHTDSVGSDAYNQRLSERRAMAVKEYLISRGVSPSVIAARGAGESQPVASNATAAGRAQNRRVDVTVDSRQ
jgi:OOP family OmpA-OmpF porin